MQQRPMPDEKKLGLQRKHFKIQIKTAQEGGTDILEEKWRDGKICNTQVWQKC